MQILQHSVVSGNAGPYQKLASRLPVVPLVLVDLTINYLAHASLLFSIRMRPSNFAGPATFRLSALMALFLCKQ